MAKATIGFDDLPRGKPEKLSERDRPARALWRHPDNLHAQDVWRPSTTAPLIGQDTQGRFLCVDDDRHLLTVAGSRAGKGVGVILPNLAIYKGSVLVLDPKGENATITAERRGKGRGIPQGGLGQEVHVLDPFRKANVAEEYRSTFNPMASLSVKDRLFIDDCASIADSLIMARGEDANDHWNSSARLVLRGLIAWVGSGDSGRKDLLEVMRLLHLPPASEGQAEDANSYFDDLLSAMLNDPDRAFGVPADMAGAVLGMGDDERGSVLSTARQNLQFLSSPPMAETLRGGGGREPDLRAFKYGDVSIYLCLPAGVLHTHARFFRLFINRLLAAAEDTPPVPREAAKALLILDEMHVLGHMAQLETAAGLMAGYGLRIWSFWQDFTQAEAIYGKRWQTFIGNAGIVQAFGLNDLMTLQHISDRLGSTSVIQTSTSERNLGQAAQGFSGNSQSMGTSPLLAADEVAYYFSRQSGAQMVIYAGQPPIWMRRMNYWDSNFVEVRSQ